MPMIAGNISAAPTPIRARVTIRNVSVGAMPPAADISAKIAAPAKKLRLRPNMEASRPPVAIITPSGSA